MADSDDDDDLEDRGAQAFLTGWTRCSENKDLVFHVQGRNGQSFEVRMVAANTSMFCTCTTCLRKEEICTHLLFVMGRVLRLTQAQLESLERGGFALPPELFQAAVKTLQDTFLPRIRAFHGYCPVCLNAFADALDTPRVHDCLECDSTYHKTCFNRLRKANAACPVCLSRGMLTDRARAWHLERELTRESVRKTPHIPPSLKPPPRIHYRAPPRTRPPDDDRPISPYPDDVY
jgi:hypothetical protein